MKLLKYIVYISLLSMSTARASTMLFFPSTGNYAMYCKYSGQVLIDTTNTSINAIDAKIFTNNIILNSFSGTLFLGSYASLGANGSSLFAVTYPWQSYLVSSLYQYVNWYASDMDTLLNTGTTALFSYVFSSSGVNTTSGSLDFYYIAGSNLDDSNMQSGIVNGFVDSIDSVNSGYYSFFPRPCIDDTDAPLFTGYASGASYNADTVTGFYFTIYDFTGNQVVGYNTTEHYRFQSGTPDTGNLINYVSVSVGSGIDNQEGINSGTITVSLSGIVAVVSGNLLSPLVLSGSDLNCNAIYAGPGYPLTWDRHVRGYTCFVPFTGINFETSQIVQVNIVGADVMNFNGNVHTGTLGFTFSLVKSGTFFAVKAYPGSRPGGDFSNIGILKFYDVNKIFITSGSVTTDSSGLSTTQINSVPNGIYYVLYKGQSHLASYLSGISVTVGNLITLDFTTGTNLFNTQNKSLLQNDGYQRQIAGDLKSIADIYDYTVNGNDIAILVMSGFIDSGIGVLDPKNLNGDVAINVSDISVIGANFQLKDPFHATYSGLKFVW